LCKSTERHADRKGSPLGGIIYNVRGALDNPGLVEQFAKSVGSNVAGAMPNKSLTVICILAVLLLIGFCQIGLAAETPTVRIGSAEGSVSDTVDISINIVNASIIGAIQEVTGVPTIEIDFSETGR